MAATRDVVLVLTEAGRARRQQHHALAAQRPARGRHRLRQRLDADQREPRLLRHRCEQRVDARAIGAHRDERGRRVVAHVRREIGPVHTPVVPADQQRDAASREAVQRGQRGVRRGADGIVDPGDAVARPHRLQTVGQRTERLRLRGQRQRIDAPRLQRRQHGAQVAPVMASRQWQRAGVHDEHVAPVQIVLAQVPTVGTVEPAYVAVRQHQCGQPRIGGVEHGDARVCVRDELQLVLDVTRLAAVPVQVLGEQVQDDRHVRACAAVGDIAGLIAGQFDGPFVRRRPRIQHLQHRQTDIARQDGALSRRTQQMREQRGGRALALGAGDAERMRDHAVVARVFAEPQAGAPDEAGACPGRGHCRGGVGADTGRLDDDLERGKAFGARFDLHRQQRVAQRRGVRGFLFVAEQRQRQRGLPHTHGVMRGAAFTSPAPQRDTPTLKLRNSHAGAPTAQRECGARHRFPATAPRRVQTHRVAGGSPG